ncbi:MAG: type II CRISPR-associated endonuclease Cas1 [Clostridium sp.]|nr:type II CRISPR-associated endonuclease Cas1 [Clostridium sp.]
MAYRVVLIENEVEMRVKLNNLIVRKNGEDIWIPLDDISMIIIDNLFSMLTIRILWQLADKGIGLIICDQKHLPVGYYNSYDNHTRASKVLGEQIKFTDGLNNIIWKEIVKQKIMNQGKAYYILCGDMDIRDKIWAFSENLEDGDSTNREGHAAKVYFNSLMGCTFSRGNDDIILNSGLNYGYAIIRSYIARLCVGYGLNTQIGIHHRNEYNRFNLVDDIMEPIRPFVDILAYRLLNSEKLFKPEHRYALINILNHNVIYRGKRMYLSNALDEYVEQFASFVMGRCSKIEFPDIENYIGEKDEI